MSFEKVLICLLATFWGVCAGQEHFHVFKDPALTSFRRIGMLTDGVAHAHLAVQFDLGQEAGAVLDLLNTVNKVSTNTSSQMWIPILHSIKPVIQDWAAFRKELSGLSHGRPKRQLIIAAAAGGALAVSAGAGIYAALETKKLQARLDSSDANVKHLLNAAHSSARLEKRVRDNVSILKKAVLDVSNTVGELNQAVIVSEAAHELLHRMRQRLHGLKRIFEHRLDEDLLAPAELNSMFNSLVAQVEASGYVLVLEGVHQLHRVDLSFTLKENKLVLFLHVPVTARAQGGPLALFQHVQLPVRHNGSYAALHGDSNMLAVDTKKQYFVELQSDDLTSCTTHGRDITCPSVFPRTRGGEHHA